MNLITVYRLTARIKHHIRKSKHYKKLHRQESMIYGVEATIYDDMYIKQEWHLRYANRLRNILNKRK